MSKPVDPDCVARVHANFARQTFMRTLGARITGLEPGQCELTLPFQPSLCQQHGYLHAAVITALSDSAAGHAALSLMPAGSSVLAVEYKQNFLAPAVGDALIARGKVVRAGKTIAVVVAEAFAVKDGTEKLVGLLQATMMRMSDTPDA